VSVYVWHDAVLSCAVDWRQIVNYEWNVARMTCQIKVTRETMAKLTLQEYTTPPSLSTLRMRGSRTPAHILNKYIICACLEINSNKQRMPQQYINNNNCNYSIIIIILNYNNYVMSLEMYLLSPLTYIRSFLFRQNAWYDIFLSVKSGV